MEKEKMLNLMKFWLFGTFLIIIVAETIYVGAALRLGLLMFKMPAYWITFLVAAVLCVMSFYIYKWYLDKKD